MSKVTKLNTVQISLQISVKCYPNHFPGNKTEQDIFVGV